MYETFYGLREQPFNLTPDPRFLFLAPRHREALSVLRYGLSTPRGLTVLLGEAGTGKTTLVRAALASLDGGTHHLLLTNPTLTRDDFYRFLARGFGMSTDAADSKTHFLGEFQRNLESWFRPNRPTAIIVDEAQSLSNELLEEIRLLTNIESESVKLLNVVLAGQPELADRLNGPELRQLKQRVALRCWLEPLDLGETASYISARLRTAGGTPGLIFTRSSVIHISEASGGIPRLINVLCDNAMLSGYATQAKPIGRELIDEVCRDFDLGNGTAASLGKTARRRRSRGGPSPVPDMPLATLDNSALLWC
jgi:general secretion pathway protein A